MKSMNLFSDTGAKSSEASFGNTKPKKKIYSKDFKKKAVNLASKVGVAKAAENLGISTSSIYSWQKIFGTSNLAKSSTPIQDEDGNLVFSLERKTYFLNVNSEEERKRVKKEVNSSSSVRYNWFKEETGEEHWVLYNTEIYEISCDSCKKHFLHYKKDCDLNPVISINATSCYLMFSFCKTLIQPDLSGFNTSNITTMKQMFLYCEILKSLDLSNFDTSQVTNMYGMFYGCAELTELDLSNFNTSNIIDMGGMFYCCLKLTQLDLSSFNTNKVTNMESMFYYCKALTQLDLSNFDTSQVTSVGEMFYKCKSLIQLDLSNFDTSSVVNMRYMFSYCETLIQLDLSSFDTSKVIYMTYMFCKCIKLTAIFISNKWNTNRVDSLYGMFDWCYSLPNFNQTDIEMAKPVEDGGYLTLKQ